MITSRVEKSGSFNQMFGRSKITDEERIKLFDICKKIRKLDITSLSKNSLQTAHDILTGGASFPATVKTSSEQAWHIYSELDTITKNPPPARLYINKLEKVYQALKLR
jgi:hypothetical protein